MLKIIKNIFQKKNYKIFIGLCILIILILLLSIFQYNLIEKFRKDVFKEVKTMTNSNREGEYPMSECKTNHYTYFTDGTAYLKTQKQIEIIKDEMKKDKKYNKDDFYLLQIYEQNKNLNKLNKKMNKILRKDEKKDVSKRCFDIDEFYK